jgi:hypothetical protein
MKFQKTNQILTRNIAKNFNNILIKTRSGLKFIYRNGGVFMLSQFIFYRNFVAYFKLKLRQLKVLFFSFQLFNARKLMMFRVKKRQFLVRLQQHIKYRFLQMKAFSLRVYKRYHKQLIAINTYNQKLFTQKLVSNIFNFGFNNIDSFTGKNEQGFTFHLRKGSDKDPTSYHGMFSGGEDILMKRYEPHIKRIRFKPGYQRI